MAAQTTLAQTMSFIGIITQPRVIIVGLAFAQLLYDVLTLGRLRFPDDIGTIELLYGLAILAWLVVASAKQSACEWRVLIATALIVQVAIDGQIAASGSQSTVTQWTWLIDALWLAGAILLFPSQDKPSEE